MSALTSVRTEPVDATPLTAADGEARRHLLAHVLFVLVALVAWLFLFLFVLSGFTQGHAQQQLYGTFRDQLAEGTAPTGAPIAEGAPVAMIDAPALGLRHEIVVEGTRPADLESGPGHLLGSVLPGQEGTSVLLGRALSYGGPFGGIAGLRQGDGIEVTTAEGVFHYVVDDVRRPGQPVPAALAPGGSRLTLVSASGGSTLSPSRTIYADATLQGKAQPPGAVAATDPSGAPMSRDASAGTLAILALCLELLIGVLVAAVWASLRWSRIGAWTVGVPVVLGALWLTSIVATRLLPNLV